MTKRMYMVYGWTYGLFFMANISNFMSGTNNMKWLSAGGAVIVMAVASYHFWRDKYE